MKPKIHYVSPGAQHLTACGKDIRKYPKMKTTGDMAAVTCAHCRGSMAFWRRERKIER